MSHEAIPAKSISDSPVEHTLGLLKERLFYAEGETQNLAKKLANYGFKRIPEEKPDFCQRNYEEGKMSKNQSNDVLVTRLCQMESLITSLRSGMESLEAEKSTTIGKLMQEKSQILENYSEELSKTREELEKSKITVSAHTEAKLLLDKQIGKLKKEMMKRVEMQKNLVEKLKEKEMELQAFQSKLSEVSKELSLERTSRRKVEDSHSSLLLKITEMEASIESEHVNVENLNQKCISLTEDALLARGEFEKEFDCRLQYQNVVAAHGEEIKTANENLQKYDEQNKLLCKKLEEFEEKYAIVSAKNEKLKVAFDETSVENNKLNEALKNAAIDNQALLNQNKLALSREQSKIDQTIEAQNKLLDSAKNSLLKELDKQQKYSQTLESQNLELTNKVNDLVSQNGECDFKLKMLQQSKANDTTRLQNMLSSAEKVKDELARQLKQKEKELVDMSSSLSKEKDTLLQKYEEAAQRLKETEEKCEILSRDKSEITEKLSWVTVKQVSQENIENKFTEMVSEKNKLAYEKGVMQSKTENLESELNLLLAIKEEKESLQSKNQLMVNEHTEMKQALDKVDNDLRHRNSDLQKVTNELKMCKTKSMHSEKNISQLTLARNEALEQREKLLKEIESINKKYEEEICSYQSRLISLENERGNVSTTFESMMSTNNNLQKDLERIQGIMGKKDVQIEEMTRESEKTGNIVKQLQGELKSLTSKINKLDKNENNEISSLKEKLQIELSGKNKLQNIYDKQKEEMKNMKTAVKKVAEDLKNKDNELKAYINAKHTDLENVKKEHDDHIVCIKEGHKKEIYRFKKHIQDQKILASKKEKDKEHENMSLNTFTGLLKDLEEDKKLYMEKNEKQSNLLEEFMSQIADLQAELSNIIESKTETNDKLREKENMITTEKRKRRDIEQKYKDLLKAKMEKEVLETKKIFEMPGMPAQGENPLISNNIDKLLTEEKRQTQKLLEDYEYSMQKAAKKLGKQPRDTHKDQNERK